MRPFFSIQLGQFKRNLIGSERRYRLKLDLRYRIVSNSCQILTPLDETLAMKKLLLIALTTSTLGLSNVYAADMPDKAKTCVGCHGADGNSMVPTFPKLAGQHAQYLEKALKDFRDGFRKDATMQAFAKGLSDKEIKDLAAYYAAQTAK